MMQLQFIVSKKTNIIIINILNANWIINALIDVDVNELQPTNFCSF